MNIKFIPAALVVVALSSAAAFAADTNTTGVVKSIDAKTQQLILADGTVYKLPKGFNAATVKVGEKVLIGWYMAGSAHMADSVKAAT
jgi:Cu/Ag efflux protein CusF